MKTFIRRPGNKTNHLKHIVPLLPKEYDTYIEPFLGSGALYLHLLPEKAILNDLNEYIAGIWNLVKHNPSYFLNYVKTFAANTSNLSTSSKKKFCDELAKSFKKHTKKEKLVIYHMLTYCSYSGIIEYSDKIHIKGLYLPFYSDIRSLYPFSEKYKQHIMLINEKLKNTKVYNLDYKQILKKAKPGDFVFLDPPYIEDKKYDFQYLKGKEFDIYELLNQVKVLDKLKIKWMMTQADTDIVRLLFKDYNIKRYDNINRLPGRQCLKKELIITNYKN